MKTIAFIVPYICKGKQLPNYFQLWLETCRYNPTIDFLIFTDDKTVYDYPKNTKIHYVTFEFLKELFQKNFDFEINLEKPYKFCDFKPAYGEIFSEYLKGYDFWGHCDIDLFFGNIRNFITEEILQKYNRIYTRGHCCLYKNEAEVNGWYRNLPRCEFQFYKDVFMQETGCCFDEWAGHCGGGLSQIISANNIEQYDEPDMADLDISKNYFKVNRWERLSKDLIFEFDSGQLFACSNGVKKETIYVHFQKRPLIMLSKNKKHFFFVAPGYVVDNIGEIKKVFCILNKMKFLFNYYWKKSKTKMNLGRRPIC
ncbi:DUF6625 family protein [Clostridium sp. Marseille-P299]|uniref:DUF6625 family protein n=1 Tax=Clostridium sp. Marseille-P299 TaxID=1805477 RepID=UPI000835235F|nr:DUF6625 family protein [Clostridium sp. Marseille-P299]